MLRRLFHRLGAQLRRGKIEREMDRELRFHLEMEAAENMRRGMSEEEARRAALLSFGGVERTKESYRDIARFRLVEDLWRDLRYGARTLAKQPGFALIAIITLALGIGANAAVFSVVHALLLRQLPYPQAERLVYVWVANPQKPDEQFGLSPHNFSDLRRYSGSFDSYFAFRYANFALTGDGQPESLNGVAASADFGRAIGVRPALGRLFTPEEDSPGKNRVAVISHGLWRRRFAGDSRIVGRKAQLNGEAHTIIGVMPPQFAFPNPGIDVWAPLALDLAKYRRGTSFLQSVAWLKPGVSLQQANAEANAIGQRIVRENANSMRYLIFNLTPLRKQIVGDIERPLLILFGAVTLVLAIACVNVANLTLGRATARWKEFAMRAALGASRWSLIRLLLTESVLLSLAGGALGLWLARYGVGAMLSLNPEAIPNAKSIGVDGPVIAFTFGMALATGIIFGLIPAWRVSKTDLNQALRGNSRTVSGAGNLKLIRGGLVVAEIGLSLVLLISAGLLLKSFWRLIQVNPGFRAENVVTASVSLPRARYADEWLQAEFFRRALEALQATPGVQHASAVTNLPFSNSRDTTSFSIDGRPAPPNTYAPQADYHEVFPGYFQAMGIPMKAGRDFTEADDRSRPGVVIINERAAQKYFPNETPIGKRLTIGSPKEEKLYGKGVSREIVGVIGNVKLLELNAEFQPELYVPALQMPADRMELVARGGAPAERLINGLRDAAQSVDPQQPIRRARSLETAVKNSVAPQRFIAALLLLFAGVALALSLVGIYGVVSYGVSQRSHEIGIRMALGAQAGDLLRMVVGQGLRLTLIGAALGMAAALGLTRVMESLLFKVSATDPAIFVSVSLLLVIVALVACYIPARRAAKVDPLIALRTE